MLGACGGLGNGAFRETWIFSSPSCRSSPESTLGEGGFRMTLYPLPSTVSVVVLTPSWKRDLVKAGSARPSTLYLVRRRPHPVLEARLGEGGFRATLYPLPRPSSSSPRLGSETGGGFRVIEGFSSHISLFVRSLFVWFERFRLDVLVWFDIPSLVGYRVRVRVRVRRGLC